jgi:diadenosine tetraphosphatase ApaH/serine/threonine PP2A family protein phosphatase
VLKLDEVPFNAAIAAQWTQENNGSEAIDFMNVFELADTEQELDLFHASPRVRCGGVLSRSRRTPHRRDGRVGAIGHSHVALFFTRDDNGGVRGEQAPGGTEVDISSGRWLINPGGVGQPRDGDPRAAWLVLDSGSWTAEWRRVEYPIAEAAQAIERAGLPQQLADRLFRGE